MFRKYFFFSILISAIYLYGCSKKVYPTNPETNAVVSTKTDTMAAVKKVIKKRKIKEPVPKTIAVNDAIAKKTVDGRLYYDLDGYTMKDKKEKLLWHVLNLNCNKVIGIND